MKRSVVISITIILSGFLNFVSSHERMVLDSTITEKCYSKEIIVSSPSEYIVRIKLHNLIYSIEENEGREFVRLLLDGGNNTQKMGEPSLPLIIQHIGLPPETSYNVEITENKWVAKPIGLIYPGQNSFITDNNNSVFFYSDSVYKSHLYKYPLYEVSNCYHWRNIENFYISICPFKYHPSERQLFILTDFTLTVRFNPNKDIPTTHLSFTEKENKWFDNNGFLSNFIKNNRETSSNDNYNYLIIVGNMPEIENSQAMRDFRRWKALKGFKSKIVSTATIGTDSASIKNYITQQKLLGVEYVLFVGDHQKIPLARLSPNHSQYNNEILKSDYWYGCINNNEQAEIPIGRFLTNSLDNFSNMVNKTINYESVCHDWTNKVLLVSHIDSLFRNTMEIIRNTTFSQPMTFTRTYAGPTSGGGTNSDKFDVIDSINSGKNIVTINSHGNAGCFWIFNGDNSTITYEDCSLLSEGTYPIIFSGACYNGDFTEERYSIAKHFTCSDHSSCAFIGGTMPVYTYPCNVFFQYLYNNLLNDNYFYLGQLLLKSHMDNWNYNTFGIAIDNAYNCICAGDPTLEIWTGLQYSFDKTGIKVMDDSLLVYANTDSFNLNVVSEDSLFVGSSVSVQNNCKIPIPLEDCEIALNKHNHIPFVVKINVDDCYIQNTTFNQNTFFSNSPLSIGYDVTSSIENGNVTIEPGTKVMLNKGNGVLIKNGFECKLGAEFTIE